MINKIGFFYGHVASNIGDIAINKGEVNLLKKIYPNATIHVVLLNVEKSKYLPVSIDSFQVSETISYSHLKSHGSNAFSYQSDPEQFLKICGVKDADLIVISSGEHLFSYLDSDNIINLFWRTLPAFAAKITGKKCIVLPSTFGPFEDLSSRDIMSSFFNIVDGFAVRESHSGHLLSESFQLPSPDELLDPAFFLEPEKSPTNKKEKTRSNKILGLIIRSEGWGIRLPNERRSRLTTSFKSKQYRNSFAYNFAYSLCKSYIEEHDGKVILFVQTASDQEIAETVLKSCKKSKNFDKISIYSPDTIEDYLFNLSKVDDVVSSRFHAIIFGLLLDKRVYGLYFKAHGHKMPGLFEMLNLENNCVNLSETETDDAKDLILTKLATDQYPYDKVSNCIIQLRLKTIKWVKEQENKKIDTYSIIRANKVFGVLSTKLYNRSTNLTIEKIQTEKTAIKNEINNQNRNIKNLKKENELRKIKVKKFENEIKSKNDQLNLNGIELKAKQDQLEIKNKEIRFLNNSRERAITNYFLNRSHLIALQNSFPYLFSMELVSSVKNPGFQTLAIPLRLFQLSYQMLYKRMKGITQIPVINIPFLTSGGEIQTISFFTHKYGNIVNDGHVIRYSFPEGGSGYLSSKNTADFNKPPMDWTISLKPNKEYRFSCSVRAIDSGSVNFYFIQYNKKTRITSDNNVCRKKGDFNFFINTHKNHDSLCIAIRLSGYGKLELSNCSILEKDEYISKKKKYLKTLNSRANISFSDMILSRMSYEDSASYINIFTKEGIDKTIEAAKSDYEGMEPYKIAMWLFTVGKAFRDYGINDTEFQFAKAAIKIEKNIATLRGYFFAAQRANKLRDAYQAIQMIEEMLAQSPSQYESERLNQLKRSPAYQLSVLKKINSKKAIEYIPKKNRVCYVLHNSLPYSSGGYATRSQGVAQGLVDNGYDVIILTRPGYPNDIIEDLDPKNVPPTDHINQVKYLRTLEPRSKGKPLTEYIKKSADKLEALFRRYRPEFVMAASNYRIGLMAIIAARRLGIPFIYEVRGWWEITRMSRDIGFEKTPSFTIQTLLETECTKRADHVFTLTEPMREEMIRRGTERSKITLLPNSCDPERFEPMEKDHRLCEKFGIPVDVPVIGYIGTFVDYEGLEDLTQACAMLKKNGTTFRLLLVGNENTSGKDKGPITEKIDEIAHQDGLKEWLIMPGRVPHEEVKAYYSLIDIAPFPRKPWPVCEMVSPMKPLEAMAMEKGVVVSSVRALVDMIQDGKTGLIFKKGNKESLSSVLQTLIEDPTLRAKVGKAGREWVVKERTWGRVGQIFKRIGDDLCAVR